MARKKNKGNRRGADDSSDDEDRADRKRQTSSATPAPLVPTATAAAPTRSQRKEKRQQAKQHQPTKNRGSDGEDSDDDDLAALLGGKLNVKTTYGDDSSDSGDNGRKQRAASATDNKKAKGRRAASLKQKFAVPDSSDSDLSAKGEAKEDADQMDDGDSDNESVQQVALKLADDDWGGLSLKPKKEKKEKAERKEKKHKKVKKHKKEKKERDDLEPDNGDRAEIPEVEGTSPSHPLNGSPVPELAGETVVPYSATSSHDKTVLHVETAKSSEPKAKTKFELKMEAALQKKNDASAQEKVAKAATSKPSGKLAPEPEPDWVDTSPKTSATVVAPGANTRATDKPLSTQHEEMDGIVYGAPDDVVWSDKSHAQKLAEAHEADGTDESAFLSGPDGKKLSNKERKKLLKAKQAAEREAAFQTAAAQASKEGAQFACSQTAVNENDPQWENSLDVSVPSFNISAAGKILFKDASLSIAHGRRYGLVGPNGRGKSTLLKMIASRDLKLPPRIDFLYVEQEVVADDTPAVDAVLKADERRWNLLAEEKKLMQMVDAGDESEATIARLQEVVDELTNMGADSAEAKARRILYGLGFTMDMQTKPTRMFSGGWRMRISLARALFIEPTLLMLDEPTNHLDLNAVIWLDEYLQKWKKTLLIVSHDQDFLNTVCQEILHIENLKLISYKGNYDDFKKAEKTKFEQQVKAWEKQEKRLRELKKSGQSRAKAEETVMRNASKREAGARAQKKKNQAIASGHETAETQELIERPREYQVKLEFAEVAELSRPVIEVSNVHFRYSPKHPIIFDKIDFGIDMDSRICIVGPNGAGKTTLLKLLTGELEPTKGEVKRNPRLRMGIYNQHFVDRLPMNKTPVEHLRDRFQDEDYQSIRNRLGKYGLEGHAHEVTMRDLSGGQKARVVFVELSLQRPHVLLLDEPTNNLDIETIDALCDAIKEFNGGIVVVTHDQRLIEECECTLWVVEKEGVTKWEEGFDDYRATILRELEEQVEKETAARRVKLDAAAQLRAEKLSRLATKVSNPKR